MPDWLRLTLLLAALCCVGTRGLSQTPAGCPDSNYGEERVVIRAIGEVWTKPGCLQGECGAKADGSITVHWRTCDPRPFPDCEVEAIDRSAQYPACCPVYRCPGHCFSSHLRRWFFVGDAWTEEGCTQARCTGTGEVSLLPCGLVSINQPGCHLVKGNATAEYPRCCHQVQCDPGEEVERPCYDKELDRHFAVGESWTLPGCSGQAICGEGGQVSAVGCPQQASVTPGCSLDDGDPSQEYPQCCPKITCEICSSQRHERVFGPGDIWVGRYCTKNQCNAGPHGANVWRRPCDLLGLPPSPDCQLVGEDWERGDYPSCCAFHHCPGRCRSQGRWFSVGEQWDQGCTRAICIGTDHVEQLVCPQIRPDPARPDCYVVDGNVTAAFPGCCPTIRCDSQPEGPCQDAAGGDHSVGDSWTESGCVRAQCQLDGDGAMTVSHKSCPPRPYPDCRQVEEDATAEYPDCCPTYRCPGRCFSPPKSRWFSVGDEWTEAGCTQSVCAATGQVRQLPCGFVTARRPGCRVVEGDANADYPDCCHRVQCEPNPYG